MKLDPISTERRKRGNQTFIKRSKESFENLLHNEDDNSIEDREAEDFRRPTFEDLDNEVEERNDEYEYRYDNDATRDSELF